jgi:hypothetical protein
VVPSRLGHVHLHATRRTAMEALAAGASLSDVSRRTGVARSTLRAWTLDPPLASECPRCVGAHPVHGAAYATLLGYYLGDGCLSYYRSSWALRVSCDNTMPGIYATSRPGSASSTRRGRYGT